MPPAQDGVLEIAMRQVRPGQATAFEAAFAQALAIIAGMPGVYTMGRHV